MPKNEQTVKITHFMGFPRKVIHTVYLQSSFKCIGFFTNLKYLHTAKTQLPPILLEQTPYRPDGQLKHIGYCLEKAKT